MLYKKYSALGGGLSMSIKRPVAKKGYTSLYELACNIVSYCTNGRESQRKMSLIQRYCMAMLYPSNHNVL